MRNKLLLLAFSLIAAFIGWRTYQFQVAKENLPTRKSLIQNELEVRLSIYAKNVKERCEDEVLKAAKINADSIVFIKANELMLFDSLRRPEKPLKPELPEKKELIDTLAIEPLVKF